jgi:phage replication O-like protein O
MANPQAENGHIDIANEIAEAMMRVNLSAYESRVLWFLFRKTYGWKKKSDWITLSQFSQCTGLDRRLVHRAIKGLSSKQMIVIYKDDKNRVSYGFQKDFEKWELSSKKMTVIDRDDKVSSIEMTKLSSKEIPTKETIKDTFTKDNNTPPISPRKKQPQEKFILPDWIDSETWDSFQEMRKSIKKPMTDKAKDLLIKKLEAFRARGHDIKAIMEQSVFNSWQDVYELKDRSNGNGNGYRSGAGQTGTRAGAATITARSDENPYPPDREF